MKKVISVLVTLGLISIAHAADTPDACLSRLPELVCLVAPPKVEKDRYRDDRVCEKGIDISRFVRQVQAAYDRYPGFLQKQLCTLKKIYLEEDFFGNAWSDTGMLAVNKKLSDANPDAGSALSGFDQLSFGGQIPGYTPSLPAPMVKITPSISIVTHTLLHELAHVLDYRYEFQKKGWAKLSASDFPLRKRICLNSCAGKTLPAGQIGELYRELSQHGYVSQLSAVSPMEDFAETFSFVLEHDSMGSKMSIEAGDQVIDPLASEAISGKITYVRKVVEWLNRGGTGGFSAP